ncbi:hypothetical protein KC349_g5311 [Hortaea werneckii]|nr:hypothetical protein KC349_g5311 [Hortaea werneckii]
MYDDEAGIEVFVRLYGSDTAYREYQAPKSSPFYTGHENERYIEAVSGERFEVFVKLDKSFDFKNYTQARADLNIDGGSIDCYEILAKPKRRTELITLLHNSLSCDGDEWKCVGFCFRELSMLEDNHLTIQEEEDEVLNRGRIEVTLQLGRNKLLAGKFNSGHNYPLPEGTSKKVAVDKGRSHSVIVIPIDYEATEEDVQKFEWVPATGDAGEQITFTFLYASRMILELKNVIATTADAPNEPTEGEQTKSNQSTESGNEEAAPLILATGSNFPQKPKEIISLDSEDEEQPPSTKIKTEIIEGFRSTEAVNQPPTTSMVKGSKGREKARIKAQLEDIRLHMEQNRLQREESRLKGQMMDLDDEE